MAEEVVLMKGNEAIAHAAIRCGADGYFGYPITPQSEVLDYSPIGSIGNSGRAEALGNHRHGGVAGRERGGVY